MTLNELDDFFNAFLKKEDFAGDPSLNGIQIQNSAPDALQVTKVAFAVDACEATARAAAEAGEREDLEVRLGEGDEGCRARVRGRQGEGREDDRRQGGN